MILSLFKKFPFIIAGTILSACGGGSSSSNNDIITPVANTAPTIAPIGEINLNENSQLTLVAEIKDADGEIAKIQWQQESGVELTLSTTTSASIEVSTPTVDQDQTAQLKLTVTDNAGASTSELVDITIKNSHFNIELVGNANVNGLLVEKANVDFVINDQLFTAQTDVDGNYHMPIDVAVENEFYNYQISVQGENDQSHIQLFRTGHFEDMLTNASKAQLIVGAKSDKKVSALSSSFAVVSENTNVNIDAITTSEYQYLLSLFENNTELLDIEYIDSKAFKRKYKHIDAKLMLEIATAFSYAAQNNQTVNTENGIVSIQEFLLDIFSNEENKKTFDALLSEQQSNISTKASDLFELGKTYYTTLASANGTVRLGADFQLTYLFNEDGTFSQQEKGLVSNGTWQEHEKSIKIVLDSPSSDVLTDQQIPEAGVRADCTYTSNFASFNALSGNKSQGVVNFSVTFNSNEYCVTKDGQVLRDGIKESTFYVMGYTQDDMEFWQNKDIANQSIVFDHINTDVVSQNPFEDSTSAVEYAFNDDGTGKVIELNDSFTWQIDTEGKLLMTFDAGYTVTWLKMYDDLGDGKNGNAIFATYLKDKQSYVYQNLGITVDQSVTVSADSFIGSWDHGFNLSQSKYKVMGNKFFFELNADNTGTTNTRYVDGSSPDIVRAVSWYQENESIIITRTYIWDENGWGGHSLCDPRVDENCFYLQYRKWQILKKQGQRIYVKESLYYDQFPHISARQGGTSIQELTLTERTNFYEPAKGNN